MLHRTIIEMQLAILRMWAPSIDAARAWVSAATGNRSAWGATVFGSVFPHAGTSNPRMRGESFYVDAERATCYYLQMDTLSSSDDPLDRAIASIEAAIEHGGREISDIEARLTQKRQSLQLLTVEIKALKRAASLRPVAA